MPYDDETIRRILAGKQKRPAMPRVKHAIAAEWGKVLSHDVLEDVLGVARRTAFRIKHPDDAPPHPFQIFELHLRLGLPQLMNAFYLDMGLPWLTAERVPGGLSVDPEMCARIELEALQGADDAARVFEEITADGRIDESERLLFTRATDRAHMGIERMYSMAEAYR